VATEVSKRFLGPTAVAFVAVAMMISSFGSLHCERSVQLPHSVRHGA
jgi:hypothetical protein